MVRNSSIDEDLILDAETGHYTEVPKSKASAHSPTEQMNFTAPTAPRRFSGAHKPHSDEHGIGHYSVRGAWLCHTGRMRRVNEDSMLAGGKFYGGSTEKPAKIAI